MYDGTKKNWSQRLKIHNRTKSNPLYPTTTSVTNTNLNLHQTTIKDTPNIVHNGNISNATKQQQKPKTVFRGHSNKSVPSQKTAVMLLPDDFPLNYDYNAVVNSVAGGSTRGTTRKYENLTQGYSFASKMKYDEPWIYSTVRGVPGQPLSFYHNIQNHVFITPSYSHHPLSTAILATPTLSVPASSNKSAVAVVICSCPGYLFGTKRRELKKALICKKCKGTQLPVSSMGRPIPMQDHIGSKTIPLNNNKLRLSESSATVQYISPMKKMRPTILEPQKDPYSLMRRTRLLSPEPENGTFPTNNKFPNKAKFGSYTNTSTAIRERTRSRIPKPSIDHSKMNLSNKIDDNWLSEIESSSDVGSIGRRSILCCNVNPYDLISFDNQSIVSSDDYFPQKLTNNNIRSTADSKVAPRKYSHSNLFKKSVAATNKELKAGNNSQIGNCLPLNSQSTKTPDLTKMTIESEEEKSSGKSDNTSEKDTQCLAKSNKNYPKDNTVKAESLLLKCEFNNKSSPSEESSYNSPTTGIGEPCIKHTPTATHNIKSILKRPLLKSGGEEIEITATIPQIHKDAIVNESQNNNNLIILTSGIRNHEESNASTANFLSTVGLPHTRKKVQFMVVDTQQIHQSEVKDDNPQLEQEHQNNINADDVCTAFDGVLIQAMLLEKLQLDAKVGSQIETTDKHAITAAEGTPPQNETSRMDLKEPLNNANETNNKKLQLPNHTNGKQETPESEVNRKHRNVSETQTSMTADAENKVEYRNSNMNVNNKSTNNNKNENDVTVVNRTILKITHNDFKEDDSAGEDRKLTGSASTESLLSSQSNQKTKHHSTLKYSPSESPHNDEAIGIKRVHENSYHIQDKDEVSEESTWHTNNCNKNTNLNNNKTRNITTNIKETKRNDELDQIKCEAATKDNQTLSPKVTATTLGNINSKILPGCDKPQRTVVRVAPFNKNTKEIHRLKIAHTDEKIKHVPLSLTIPGPHNLYTSSNDFGQKKTSILINGDDCYSTIQLGGDDTCTPLYQSSVVVNDNNSNKLLEDPTVVHSVNAITINVRNPHNTDSNQIQYKDSAFPKQQQQHSRKKLNKSIIPISDPNFFCSASPVSATSLDSSLASNSRYLTPKHNRTLIHLTYKGDELKTPETCQLDDSNSSTPYCSTKSWLPHEEELLKILRNPVEAVKLNLVPHICGLQNYHNSGSNHVPSLVDTNKQIRENQLKGQPTSNFTSKTKWCENESFMTKLLKDPMLSQVADGLETDTLVGLIENSLRRLQDTRDSLDMSETKDITNVNRLISISLKLIQEEKVAGIYNRSTEIHDQQQISPILSNKNTRDEESLSNRGSISSINSFTSAHNYEISDLENNESDCYHSCSSEIASFMDDDSNGHNEARSKFYKMLVDATLAEIESNTNLKEEDDLDINNHNNEHEYESICLSGDPIYEEISDVPPPLPLSSPPLNDEEMHIKATRSIFEGASKYDILSYLVDARERGLVKEGKCDSFNSAMPIIIQEESAFLNAENDLNKHVQKKLDAKNLRSANYDRRNALTFPVNCNQNVIVLNKKQVPSDIERNDSGVGSESSKSSRSKYQSKPKFNSTFAKELCSSPLHLCEDCDGPVETQVTGDGILFTSFVCRKCGKKRMERKEIITEIVETEEKYGRDLQIILEEFCQPMLVAGLLTQEQLSAIFLNTEELLENSQTLAERMRDALDIALEQGDDDLLTVNIGKLFLESTQMLHAFESYCVRQAGASLLLANLEKEKELLRIFLKVSQMENTVLRRMNLNSFLMVPVQRVTKYPLLLARLYKVTPAHLDICGQLKQAQEKIELHLNHINQEAKDVPTKLWRRISSSSPNRRRSYEIDMINIKLRKMAIEILEWNHEEVRFAMEGKLLYTQPTDSNWKKARTIKFIKVIALLVTNGKPTINYKAERVIPEKLNFPKQNGIRDASLLLIKEKSGRYTLIHEPLYLDKCLVCSDADWDEYFEIQDISSKDAFIFKAEDNVRTKQWYTTLQCHAQGMGSWRKRRNALANIMINGMLTRS